MRMCHGKYTNGLCHTYVLGHATRTHIREYALSRAYTHRLTRPHHSHTLAASLFSLFLSASLSFFLSLSRYQSIANRRTSAMPYSTWYQPESSSSARVSTDFLFLKPDMHMFQYKYVNSNMHLFLYIYIHTHIHVSVYKNICVYIHVYI